MPQLTEAAAETLTPEQAAELARVIDLQARRECLLADAAGNRVDFSTPDLQARQKAYEAFRARRAEYAARYRAGRTPETTLNTPGRVGTWCRVVRAVLRRAGAGAECPAAVVEKAYRMADRATVAREGEPGGREPPPGDMAGAIRQLDAVITWCDGPVDPPSVRRPVRRLDTGEGNQVGDRVA
ncbi:MAG TPA: hypothetical protein VKE74_26820 [Gemmataceae bacterium]|nr:hypothetical protein [Gemmataceae bacterium]